MKVQILSSFVAVPFTAYYRDDVADVSAEKAEEWIAAGLAIPAKQPEFAVKSQHRRSHKG